MNDKGVPFGWVHGCGYFQPQVVNPPAITRVKDTASGVYEWERKVAALNSRYGEEIKANLKLPIFVGRLPKKVKDELFKLGSGDHKAEDGTSRDYVLSLAQQRVHLKVFQNLQRSMGSRMPQLKGMVLRDL
eukprot:12406560-Karenia_brevis.AAC.1